ncbi:MAG: hypothetical protein ABSC03_19285 [Verrucomicrobiota bacterium]|jgi:hypothetical protein
MEKRHQQNGADEHEQSDRRRPVAQKGVLDIGIFGIAGHSAVMVRKVGVEYSGAW